MELKLDAQAINDFVTQEVIKSVVGEDIKKKIESALKDAAYGYDSPLKKLVKECLAREAEAILKLPENQELIRTEVARMLTQETLKKIIQTATSEIERIFKNRDND